jgi:hypothetical protein
MGRIGLVEIIYEKVSHPSVLRRLVSSWAAKRS